jgi:hypothetical protein
MRTPVSAVSISAYVKSNLSQQEQMVTYKQKIFFNILYFKYFFVQTEHTCFYHKLFAMQFCNYKNRKQLFIHLGTPFFEVGLKSCDKLYFICVWVIIAENSTSMGPFLMVVLIC